MIMLFFKIIYYKIKNMIRPPEQAEAGTEPHTGARVTRTVDGYGVAIDPGSSDGLVLYARQAGKVTASTEKLRRLIELGLVSEPDGLGDLQRVEAWHQEWARREAGDPSACPCGGRHFPSADACCWCRCHDPRGVHHREQAKGIMQVIKPPPITGPIEIEARLPLMDVRLPNEIVPCPRCLHPQHTMGDGRCLFLPALSDHLCGCGPDVPRQVEVDDTDEAVDQAWNSFLGTPPDEDGHS
jgi:hypothetical protein